jgi:hypothetical protein
MFYSNSAQLDEYFHSKTFLNDFMDLFSHVNDIEIFNYLSHALGMLIDYDSHKFDRIQRQGCFEIYFNIFDQISFENINVQSIKGIFYFMQNYFTKGNKIDNLYFKQTFPFLLKLINNPDDMGNFIFFVILEILEYLLDHCEMNEIQPFFENSFFKKFIHEVLIKHSFDPK